MAIARYENITVNTVTTVTTNLGDQVTSLTEWFKTRARVSDVANSLRIAERYRVYGDLVNLTLNYTPNTKQMVDDQDSYSINWRNNDWRISDCREADDRMSITFLCYRNDPTAPV